MATLHTIQLKLNEKHKQGEVIIMYLPPNTTHGAQPLDVSFFGSLKHWSSVCHSYVSENPGKVITKYTFSELFCQAWYKTISPDLIIAGFRKVGGCPFDRTAIKAVSLDECKAGVDPTQDAEEQLSHQDEDCNEQLADNVIEDQIGEKLDLLSIYRVGRGTVANEIRKWIRPFH